jgi:RNA polymerase sigma-70 factor (ECF subfamily)
MTDQERLEAMYDACAHRVYAYALRHCGPDDADDVVSEAFAAAWRRIDVVPEVALPWLLVTAGNVIRNRRRADLRRTTLTTNLAQVHQHTTAGADELVAERAHLFAALERLSDLELEALLLVAWDGLDPRGAAEVARCAPRAFRARLSRARARLAAELDSLFAAAAPTLPSKEALS